MIDPSSYDLLQIEVSEDGAIVRLSFDHGKANEVSSAVLLEIEALTKALTSDGHARALVSTSRRVTSRGTPIFVAGADVNERVGWSTAKVKAHVRWQRHVLARLRDVPIFHVVVVGGVAFGWGTEWLLTADYRIAADGASFALPETGIGIVPGAGGTAWLATQVGLPHALRLGMTGEAVDAVEATRIGLVQEHAPDLDAGLARAEVLARAAATRSPTASAAFKAAARAAIGQPGDEREDLERRAYDLCVDAGEAAIGREHFAAVRRGEVPLWGPRRALDEG